MPLLTAAQTWFTVELGAYLTCLTVVLSMPSPAQLWARARATMALSGWSRLRRILVGAAPAVAVAAAVGAALVIGGPGAIAFTVPVLAAVALRATVFQTALLALLAQSSLEVAIRAGVMDVGFDYGTAGSSSEASVRVGLSLISIGPLMVAASTEQRRSRLEELQNRVSRDGLTGALARDPLVALGEKAFEGAGRTRGQLAILLIDVDGFKQINDRYGYPVGDSVLAETARRCRAGLRANDHFGRIDGDEFCAVIAEATSRTCAALADQLRTLVRATPMHAGTQEIVVTISVGVAHWQAGDEAGSFADIFRQAKNALHAAKRTGRNNSILADHQRTSARRNMLGTCTCDNKS
jgi:diguanylate cyclase (GGDEF)-like protein